jgi:hypothetical protein
MRKLTAVALLVSLAVPAWIRPQEPRATRAAFVRIDWGSGTPEQLSRPPDPKCSEEIRLATDDSMTARERPSIAPEGTVPAIHGFSSPLHIPRKPDPDRKPSFDIPARGPPTFDTIAL